MSAARPSLAYSNVLQHPRADREMPVPDNSGMHRFISISLVAVTLALAPAAAAYERLPRALAALSPADFAAQVHIADAQGAVVLSTREGYTRGRVVQGAPDDDVHLRAVVDKASGRATWQVWHDLVTVRRHRNVVSVEYRAGGELRSARPIGLDHAFGQCPPTDGAGFCNKITRIGFELPERAVREMAASYAAGSRTPWRLLFRDAAGRDVTSGLAPAEAAGLLSALEAWRLGTQRDRAG
jgi:hypothetical protein